MRRSQTSPGASAPRLGPTGWDVVNLERADLYAAATGETFQQNKLDLWEQRAYRQLREPDRVNGEVGKH